MERWAAKGHEGTRRAMEMFYILTGVVGTWVYTFAKTQRIDQNVSKKQFHQLESHCLVELFSKSRIALQTSRGFGDTFFFLMQQNTLTGLRGEKVL